MPTKEEMMNFSMIIEDIVENKDVSYIDAVVIHCESSGLEIEVAAKLISANLKSKIEAEAGDLKLIIRKSHAKLPL
jgi:hypothetical protein